MKKTLLLSVVASTLIMAGGDIEPVAVPVVEEVVSGWDFSGQAVLYYQTTDWANDVDLFDQDGARANAGIQLRAVNKDIAYGIGAGVEISGVGTLGLQEDIVAGVMQSAGTNNDTGVGGWISQAYLTYGFGNTSLKAGRQELPKALSPFAFSEGWNVFKNTFDALLVVNTDIPDTTLVGAWVAKANYNAPGSDMSDFRSINPDGADFSSGDLSGDDNGVFMLTAQNKSVENLTLTGSWYYLNEVAGFSEDVNILWGDVKYNAGSFNVAIQGGTVLFEEGGPTNDDDVTAYGIKVGGKFDMISASIAYSSVNDAEYGIFNVGGVKTPLYTQLILNQNAIRNDSDTVVVRAGMKALGGNFGLAYNYSDIGAANNWYGDDEYTEIDLTYKTKVFNDSTTLFAGYVYQDLDSADDSRNLIRVWGRYNF